MEVFSCSPTLRPFPSRHFKQHNGCMVLQALPACFVISCLMKPDHLPCAISDQSTLSSPLEEYSAGFDMAVSSVGTHHRSPYPLYVMPVQNNMRRNMRKEGHMRYMTDPPLIYPLYMLPLSPMFICLCFLLDMCSRILFLLSALAFPLGMPLWYCDPSCLSAFRTLFAAPLLLPAQCPIPNI